MSHTLLTEMAIAMMGITTEHIERSALALAPPNEKDTVVGPCRDPEALALWALADEYQRQAQLAGHAARYDAKNAEGRDSLKRTASRLANLQEIAHLLAWLRIQDVMQLPACTFGKNISMREGYTVVFCPDEEPQMEIAGAIPIPMELLQRIMRSRKSVEPEPKPEDKSKPQ